MEITFDSEKRDLTLRERGLDFADAGKVFAGRHVTRQDRRIEYGEERFITVGSLGGRAVVLVWTPRGAARRIISMRYAHGKEVRRWHDALG